MINRRNYYRILQVQPDAPVEIIRASYRALMREMKYHPDLGGATYAAILLNEAYDVLSEPGRRAAYDRELFARYSKQTVSTEGARSRTADTTICPSCREAWPRAASRGNFCPACHHPLESIKGGQSATHRRAVSRIKRGGCIFYATSKSQNPLVAEMVDLSPSGIRFRCSEKLAPGSALDIKGPFFKAAGTVTNTKSERSSLKNIYSVGVLFLTVNFEESKGTFLSASA